MHANKADRFRAVLEGASGEGMTTLSTLCAGASALLPVSGVSMVLMTHGQTQGVASAIDGLASAIQDLEFTLGEGPGVTAFAESRPVRVDDLLFADGRWTLFTRGALDLGARSVYALPLHLGSITLGVFTLCSYLPAVLTGAAAGDAFLVADLVTEVVLATEAEITSEFLARPLDVTDLRTVVHQATGMISAQLDCGLDDALARLRGFAFASDRPIADVAGEVVDRCLRFDEL